jgi:hypothetical protein
MVNAASLAVKPHRRNSTAEPSDMPTRGGRKTTDARH